MTAPMSPDAVVPPVATLERAATVSLGRRLLKNPVAIVCGLFIVVLIIVGLFDGQIAPYKPDQVFDLLTGPSGKHWLGTDVAGQDILSRLIYSIPLTIEASLITLAVSAGVGISAGLVSGYYGKWFAVGSSWISNVLISLPAIIILLAARSVLGPSVPKLMVVFGLLIAPAFYRLMHAEVSAVRDELYVDAARVSGLSDARIISRHILTVVRAPVIILGSLIAGITIAILAGLGLIGLAGSGPSWGLMLSDAQNPLLENKPLPMLWPGLAVGLTIISLALLGSTLRDELERAATPKAKKRKGAAAPVTIASEPVVVHPDAPGAAEADKVLEVSGLAVGYDQPDGTVKTVVQDVSLVVRRGEVHGLIGESGSGKTQTAFAVMRLLPAGGRIVAGSIVFQGTDLAGISDREIPRLRGAKIAYIPQEPLSNLDPSFTIGYQLVEPLRVALKLSKKDATKRALDLLARVGIPDPQRTFDSYPHQVSGGMAQRVLIAGAVSCQPDLLIADEPTTALDVTVQAEVLDMLRDLQSEFHMGVVLVTHNFGVVADLCDRVSVMRNGRIIETGATRAVFNDPQHEYTQSLFAAILEEGDPRGPLTTSSSEAQS